MSSIQDDDNKSLRQHIREDTLWRMMDMPDKSVGISNYYIIFDNKRKRNISKVRMMNYLLIQHRLRYPGIGFIKNIYIPNLRLFGEMSRWKIWER